VKHAKTARELLAHRQKPHPIIDAFQRNGHARLLADLGEQCKILIIMDAFLLDSE